MKFEEALNKWLERASNIRKQEYLRSGYIMNDILEIDPKGKKYLRIKSRNINQPSGFGYAFCFIDKSNGNVLKPAGWQKPAPQPRGNIYTEGKEGVNAYEANYLR